MTLCFGSKNLDARNARPKFTGNWLMGIQLIRLSRFLLEHSLTGFNRHFRALSNRAA